jgi:RND superfamily putative drug exporter
LLTIAVSVWVALNLLAWMTCIPGVYLVNISKVFAIVILYGAGTDYCLFLISRYREELGNGASNERALALSVSGVGWALTASAGTVMCGLGLMSLAEFAKVRYSGPGIALSLGVGLLAALTLTPALLRLLGDWAFWPGQPPKPQPRFFLEGLPQRRKKLWEWISQRVVARPGLVWTLSVLLLLPLAALGLRVTPDYRATSQLSHKSESLQGLEVLKKHFNAGETGPLTVLLSSARDWDSTLGQLEIDHLSRGFASLDNVAEVRSLTQPLGKALPGVEARPKSGMAFLVGLVQTIQPDLVSDALHQAKKAATDYYVAKVNVEGDKPSAVKYVTRIDVILKSDPFDAASVETMRLIQTWLRTELPNTTMIPDVQTEIYGVMVGAHDLAEVTETDRVRVNSLISLGIFLILILIVRKPLLAAYLLITVLFSYLATLGATMLAGWLWSGHFLHQLDWRVMFFLFTILVAVGEDYNILLVSRAVQEQAQFGVIEGMRRALARTGGIITSCGLIMAGTFATLMLANLNTLLQIGFALAFGVLLDTFVVRPFLVPSFAILLEKLMRQPAPPAPTLKLPQKPKRLEDRVPAALRQAG